MQTTHFDILLSNFGLIILKRDYNNVHFYTLSHPCVCVKITFNLSLSNIYKSHGKLFWNFFHFKSSITIRNCESLDAARDVGNKNVENNPSTDARMCTLIDLLYPNIIISTLGEGRPSLIPSM